MKILKFIRSIKFGITLLIIIIILSIIVSFIPQNMDENYYKNNFSPIITNIIFSTNLHRFYTSITFLLLISLFFINLVYCTIYRIIKKSKTKNYNIGPDIIHSGIIFILIGGFISFWTRVEDFNWFKKGEIINIDDKKYLKIQNIDLIKYPDERPKDYITEVEIYDKNSNKLNKFQIRVNHPLKIKNISIYQNSYKEIESISLQDKESKIVQLVKDEFLITENGDKYIFNGLDDNTNDSVTFLKIEENKIINKIKLPLNSKIENFTIKDYSIIKLTGLKFVKDHGDIPIFIGIFLLFSGFIITYFKKYKERE